MSAPVAGAATADQLSLLDLLASDWLDRMDDYARFTLAVRASEHRGHVSPNDVRRALRNAHGLTIEPHRYSALWSRARRAGLLAWSQDDPQAWEVNADAASRNQGKPQRRYRTGPAW